MVETPYVRVLGRRRNVHVHTGSSCARWQHYRRGRHLLPRLPSADAARIPIGGSRGSTVTRSPSTALLRDVRFSAAPRRPLLYWLRLGCEGRHGASSRAGNEGTAAYRETICQFTCATSYAPAGFSIRVSAILQALIIR